MSIFTIKIIALILMIIDHIGEFFPDSPIWFGWLGRLAAPLFVYALAVGFHHTRNRKKYLLRLYLANVGMVFFNQIMHILQRKLDYVVYEPTNHNIFTTLFCAGVLICIWENRKEKKKFLTYIGIYIFWQAMLIKLAILIETYDYLWYGNAGLETVLRTDYIFPLLGGIWDVEGGVFFIALGVCLYCAVEDRWKLTLYYQWMMIGALPIMLACNGKRGKSFKWLFYAVYPLQFLVLYSISYWMAAG